MRITCSTTVCPASKHSDDEYADMPRLISDDEDPARPTTVTNGNGLHSGLLPLEHVQLAIAASRLRQEESIPEDILKNLHWLFNIPSEKNMDLEKRSADFRNHCPMLDEFSCKVVADWSTHASRSAHSERYKRKCY